MSNIKMKEAFKRAQQIKTQKIGNTTITTPQPKPRGRRRTDEIYAEMMDRFYEEVEMKMIDLSKWSGEGPIYKYRELVD